MSKKLGRNKLADLTDIQLKNRLAEIFWDRVKMTDGCWTWTGIKNNKGYGIFTLRGKTYLGSRVAFFLKNDRWPIEACHQCDNPICVNFYHIFEGTHKENMQDSVDKRKMKRISYAKNFTSN